jgi:DNA-binding beta-propeller fold protein YncE
MTTILIVGLAFAATTYLRKRLSEAKCVVFGDNKLYGQSKWLGGAKSRDGIVYGVPGDHPRVLRVDPRTSSITVIGPEFKGKNKWLRGVTSSLNGCIYMIPACANRVLKLDPSTDEVTLIGPSFEAFSKWRWHGGSIAPENGCIYAAPCNASRVLKIDPRNDEVTLIGDSYEDRTKWYGCLVGSDGAIYAIPQNAHKVLRIDPQSDTTSLMAYEEKSVRAAPDFFNARHKWHGCVASRHKHYIYGIPNHSSRVLKIDVRKQVVSLVGPELVGKDFGWNDGKYKYLGGVLGANDAIYFMPGFAEKVLKVVPNTDEITVLEPSLGDRQNKWQNGFAARDGCVYGIPVQAQCVLRIDTRNDRVTTLSGAPMTRDAYEGGVIVNGELFCIPMRARCMMKVVPAGGGFW